MRKILKGVIVILIVAAMLFSTVAVTADTFMQKNESPKVSIAESSAADKKITPVPFPSSRPILWDNGLPDGVDGISCGVWSGYDREVIDDFIVDGEGWYVSGAHLRIVTWFDSEPSAILGFKVIFYKNEGTECNPVIEQYAVNNTEINAYYTGNEYFSRREIAVDLEFPKEFLEPGKWWVCFQPKMNEECFWLTSELKNCSIYCSYPDLGFPKWTPGANVLGYDYGVSFTLNGFEKSKSLNLPFFELLKEHSLFFRLLFQLFLGIK